MFLQKLTKRVKMTSREHGFYVTMLVAYYNNAIKH